MSDLKPNHLVTISKIMQDTRTIFLSGLILRILLFNSITGWFHPDEVYQSMDIAYNLLYKEEITFTLLPDEYKYGIRSHIWPVLLVPILWIFASVGFKGSTIYLLTRVLISLAGLLPILMIPQTPDKGRRKATIQWLFALYFPWVYLSSHINPDGLASSLLLLVIIMELRSSRNYMPSLLTGLIIALRLHYAIILLPFILSRMDWRSRGNIVHTSLIFAGFSPRLLSDLYFYGDALQSTLAFFSFNLVKQDNVVYGELGPWFYPLLLVLLFYFMGLILPVVYLLQMARTRKIEIHHLYFGSSLLYLLVFQFIRHKEPRFVIAAAMILLIISIQNLDLTSTGEKEYQTRIIIRKGKPILPLLLLLLLLPYPVFPLHVQDGMWEAQNYVQELDPHGPHLLYSSQYAGGGNLLHHSHNHPSNLIIIGLNSTLGLVGSELRDYIDFSQISLAIFEVSTLYSYIRDESQLLQSLCPNPFFIITFHNTRDLFYELMSVLTPDKVDPVEGYEVWNCNFYKK